MKSEETEEIPPIAEEIYSILELIDGLIKREVGFVSQHRAYTLTVDQAIAIVSLAKRCMYEEEARGQQEYLELQVNNIVKSLDDIAEAMTRDQGT